MKKQKTVRERDGHTHTHTDARTHRQAHRQTDLQARREFEIASKVKDDSTIDIIDFLCGPPTTFLVRKERGVRYWQVRG